MNFAEWMLLMETTSPNDLSFLRGWFSGGMRAGDLGPYSDWLEENGREDLGQAIRLIFVDKEQRKPKPDWTSVFNASLLFNREDGIYRGIVEVNEGMESSRFYTQFDERSYRGSAYHHQVQHDRPSYRLAPKTGRWYRYEKPKGDARSHYVVTPAQVPDYPSWRSATSSLNITIKDFKPIRVEEVPDAVIHRAFWQIISDLGHDIYQSKFKGRNLARYGVKDL